MLAHTYVDQEINGWLMSEKLDGVRALWTGSELVSRHGNKFSAPGWFTRQLPDAVPLDGELFRGRGKFQATVGAVKKTTPVDAEWRKIRYCVFDAPGAEGGFEARLAFCVAALAGSVVAEVVPHRVCANAEDLNSYLSELCAQGAEGVMLRAPNSRYAPRRSQQMLKYKPAESAEAVVIGHESAAGNHTGTVGALTLRWKGIVFGVGSGLTDELRRVPPPIGSVITFGFCGLTDGGVPRFPTFISERDYE